MIVLPRPVTARYPLVKFVDSPADEASERLNLNQSTAWPVADDIDLGAPALLGDPNGIGSSYGNRTVRLTWVIKDRKPAALALQSALAREVMREGGSWLMFQLTETTAPVWFRTKRSNPGSVSLAQVYTNSGLPDSWRVSVTLEAEPFAYGPEETFAVNVPTNPISGADPMSAVMPAIKGDVPAPLRLQLPTPPSGFIYQPQLAVLPLDGAWPGSQWFRVGTAGGWVAGADTLAGGATFKVTFATNASMATRASGKVLPAFAGRYRVLVAVSCDFNISFRVGGTTVVPPWSGAQMLDFGVQSFPRGNMPTSRPYTLGFGSWAGSGFNLRIDANRASGTGSAYIFGVLLVPVDLPLDQVGHCYHARGGLPGNTTGRNEPDLTVSAGQVVTLDGEAERVVQTDTDGAYAVSASDLFLAGGFPQVTPGATNVLHLVPHKQGGMGEELVLATETLSVTCRYRPRWLTLAAS